MTDPSSSPERPASDAARLLALALAWQQDVGASSVVADEAVDWLQRGPVAPGADFALSPSHQPVAEKRSADQPPGPSRSAQPPTVQASPPRPVSIPSAAATKPALRPTAIEAGTLGELEAKLRAFDGCGLKATATNLCFYRGAPAARLMIIGEAPGRDEDLEGRPFVGRAGQVLDRMLAAIGLPEDQVHITNIVYWRPPGNRTPSPQEALACRPFLECQVSLVAPDVLLLLGGVATKHIFNTEDGIMRCRGKWTDVQLGGRKIPAMATLHPAYLLRTPASKRQAWQDILAVKHKLLAAM